MHVSHIYYSTCRWSAPEMAAYKGTYIIGRRCILTMYYIIHVVKGSICQYYLGRLIGKGTLG